MSEKQVPDQRETESFGEPTTLVDWVLDEHRRIERMFDRFEQSRSDEGRRLLPHLIHELRVFLSAVEDVIHPAVRGSRFYQIAEAYLQENLDDHEIIRRFLGRFADLNQIPDDQLYQEVLRLRAVVDHLVSEEESGLVSLAEDFLDESGQNDALLEIRRVQRAD